MRAFAHHVRPLFQPPEQNRYVANLQKQRDRLNKRCPNRIKGRHIFLKEGMQQTQAERDITVAERRDVNA